MAWASRSQFFCVHQHRQANFDFGITIMSGGRWKKLAIAAVVLTVGIVTAMLFRREETADQAFTPKKTSPEVPAQPRARSDVTPTNHEEAKLAGHIEPYSAGLERLASESPTAPDANAVPAIGPLQSAATTPLDTAQRNDVTLLKPAAEAVRNVDEAPPSGRSPLKWQTVDRPGSGPGIDNRQGDFDRRRTVSNEMSAAVLDKRHRIRDGDTLRELRDATWGARIDIWICSNSIAMCWPGRSYCRLGPNCEFRP